MRRIFICLVVVLFLSIVQCYTEYDLINISKRTTQHLTQSNLSSSSAEAISWGSPAENFYKCQAINKYYDTICNTCSLNKKLKHLSPHNYIYVKFDVVFLNIQKTQHPLTKNGQIIIDGTTYPFSGIVLKEYYKCMERTNDTKVDGKTTFSLVVKHDNPKINIQINPTDLGSLARLGIANFELIEARCGRNAHLDKSKKICVCDDGYEETITPHGGRGKVFYEKICYK